MSQKLEYDAQLGGTVVLGDHVPTYRYAAAALQELRQLVDEVSQPAAGGGKLIFQTLPKHLRRRAMSHNPKRLPRKYRRIHIAQMAKSGAQRVIKRPSRKYRRRPKNLMQYYLRRQRRHAWLETHIWHARRFHMIDRWGYRLPHYSCDKMFRACYRAGAAHCLLQDISYYVCFELHGTISSVCEGICRLSNGGQTANSSLSLKANTFISGQREGALDLFRDGQYPRAALGRATFMWRPLSDDHQQQINDETKRTLWLWVHACIYKDVASELIKVFEVKECEVDNNEAEPMETNEELSEKARDDLKIKSASHTRGRSYENATNQMKLTILKDAMNRFRLTGPLSQSVLTHALETKNLTSTTSKDWFQQLSTADTAHHFQKQHKNQSEFWSKCQSLDSPSDLLPNFVLGLNVIDPRLKRPLKRTKAKTEQTVAINEIEDPMALLIDLPKSLSDSPIWQADIRQNVRVNMMDTHTWCQMREKHALVPGSPCAFENQMQAMPLLLIQRPGLQERNMRLNYGCGWDLIVPAGYGLIVWLTLIMWGAKPGGLRESETLAREMGHELHLPDTVGGHQMANDAYDERRKKYFNLPQGKRSNYNKLAIVSPFRVPWSQLVRDWLTNIHNTKLQEAQPDFYVLRERSKLESLQAMLRGGGSGGGVKHQRSTNVPNHFFVDDHAVIQLRLRMSTRGNIGVNALICLPTQIDLKKQLKNRRNSTNDAIHLEPTLPDLNQKDRKMVKQQHQKELKRLRRRRYREKRKMQETATKRINIAPANTSALVAAQADKLQKLWLPNESCESLFSVRKQCSRETVGYVTTAGFSMAVGKVCAIGYVTANGFQALLNLQQKLALPQALCLVRDVNSPQYYLASFEVSMEL